MERLSEACTGGRIGAENGDGGSKGGLRRRQKFWKRALQGRSIVVGTRRMRGVYRVDGDGLPPRGRRIARADVAAFMLAQVGREEWVRKSPFVAW